MPFYLVTWITLHNYMILLTNTVPSKKSYLDSYLDPSLFTWITKQITICTKNFRRNTSCPIFKQTGLFIKQQTNNTLQQKKIYTFSTY